MKRILTTITITLALALSSVAQTIAYVDVQKVMNQSKKGQEYKEEMKQKIEFYRKKIEDIEKKISQIEKQIESPVLTKEAKEKKQKEIVELKTQIKKLQRQAQEELLMMKAKAEKKLLQDIRQKAKEYAEKHNIDLVVMNGVLGGVIYFDKSIDITDKIMKMLDGEG